MAVYARSTLALMLAAATGFSTVETLMYAHGGQCVVVTVL